MIPMLEPILSEFRAEAAITQRVLDRVPGDKLSWKPHPKSMSLGQLALHVARIPGLVSIVRLEEFDPSQVNFADPAVPAGVDEIHSVFRENVEAAEAYLSGMDEEAAQGAWRLVIKGKEVSSRPRVAVVRSLMLNHWYHHRGQLSVYLRLLEVPVPSIYGPSADESPFA
jgi:uncharacterized damage-inducible protein DinB